MRFPTTILLLATLSLGTAAAAAETQGDAKKEVKPPKTRKFLFTYEAAYGLVPKEGKEFEFWLPLPPENGSQKIGDMVVHSPSGGVMGPEPEYGNRIFHGSSGPRGGVAISMRLRFTAERTEIAFDDLTKPPEGKPDPPKDLARYLEGDKSNPIDGEIKALAARVTKDAKTGAAKARAVFDYVTKEMQRNEGERGLGSGDVKRAISLKRGNSLDLGMVFVMLCRAAGVPARLVVGLQIPAALSEGTIGGYHCWAEFYLEGFGWVPADPADGAAAGARAGSYFGHLDANRLQFSYGRDVTLEPPQKGDPQPILLYPYAEMDGKPLGHASYKFTFGPAPKD